MHIAVTEVTESLARLWDVNYYPEDGVYKNGNDLVFRTTAPRCPPCLTVVVGAGALCEPEGFTVEPLRVTQPAGASEDFILRALAIAQDPSLAKDLLK